MVFLAVGFCAVVYLRAHYPEFRQTSVSVNLEPDLCHIIRNQF